MSGLRARMRVQRDGFTLDVELEAASGETVAIVGPSGAGKSTLLAALAGSLAIEGEVVLDDSVLSDATRRLAPERRGTALLGQDPRLFPHLSARENVAFGPRAAGVRAAVARSSADEWLARVGLAGLGDRRPAALSGGQQQRVAIARALAASPRLVLLDEPLTSLDPVTADGIRSLLAEQLADRTCVFVTHDAVDAVALADRMLVVEAGRVTQRGPVREVVQAPATSFAASLVGCVRLVGVAAPGGCAVDGVLLPVAHELVEGTPVAAVFRPSDVRVADAERPGTWTTRIQRLEPTLAGVRVHTTEPPVALDVALDEVAARGLRPGLALTLAIDPTRVALLPV